MQIKQNFRSLNSHLPGLKHSPLSAIAVCPLSASGLLLPHFIVCTSAAHIIGNARPFHEYWQGCGGWQACTNDHHGNSNVTWITSRRSTMCRSPRSIYRTPEQPPIARMMRHTVVMHPYYHPPWPLWLGDFHHDEVFSAIDVIDHKLSWRRIPPYLCISPQL